MGYRELSRMEIIEVVRRWEAGESQRAIARASGVPRETVKKYLRAAEELGLAANRPPPTEDQVVRLVQVGRVVSAPRTWATPQADRLEPYREQITTWLQDERLQITRVQELLGQRGLHVPYSTLERFAWRLGFRPRRGRRGDTVRMAPTPPGEVAEMDFERLGLLRNPETGRRQWVWGLSVTLTYSRHSFLWPLIQQTVEATIEGLEKAWQFFQGCPKRLILDNFPAAVPAPIRSTPARHERLWSTARRARCSWTQLVCGGLGISPRSKDSCTTRADASGRAAPASTWPTHAARPDRGASRSPVSGCMRLPASCRWWSSRMKNACTCCRMTALLTTCHSGGTSPSTPITTSASSTRSTRRRRRRARRGPSWRRVVIATWSSCTAVARSSKCIRVNPQGGRSTDPDDYPPERTAYARRAPGVARQLDLPPS
jgi:transposase